MGAAWASLLTHHPHHSSLPWSCPMFSSSSLDSESGLSPTSPSDYRCNLGKVTAFLPFHFLTSNPLPPPPFSYPHYKPCHLQDLPYQEIFSISPLSSFPSLITLAQVTTISFMDYFNRLTTHPHASAFHPLQSVLHMTNRMLLRIVIEMILGLCLKQ